MSLSDLFIANSFAQTLTENAAAAPQNSLMSFTPIILIFIIFYFLLVRPQQKKFKEHQQMVNELKVNDKVVTTSGIIGLVTKIDQEENLIHLEIANDVVVKIQKQNITEVLNKKNKESGKESDKVTKKSKK